jgi:hypothetical protein
MVVMPRAAQPVTDDEVAAAIGDTYPGITSECKADDHGRLGGRVVILDYGLPDEDMVVERRNYYKSFSHGA